MQQHRLVHRVAMLLSVAALAATGSGCIAAEATQETATPQTRLASGVVTKVVDGDTAHVRLSNGSTEKVRFIGVDTPESTRESEPYGEQAAAYTKQHLLGEQVYLELDVDPRDKYGRLLAYVWLKVPTTENGLAVSDEQAVRYMFNAWLVGEGYANTMTIPPNVKYADCFRRLERQARESNRGLWGMGTVPDPSVRTRAPIPPSQASVKAPRISVIGNFNSLKFHRPECSWAKRIATSHRIAFESRQAAVDAGFVPCKVCRP